MTNPPDLAHFKAKLLSARDELRELLESRRDATATVELDQSRVGRLSRMDALQQQAMARNTLQRAELQLRRIDAALERCEAGSYGYCLDCGEPIDPRRLELDPTATRCVDCVAARGG